jgi:selenocysteine lyase/cysteine desulfurase
MAEVADVRRLFPAATGSPYFATNGYGVLPAPAAEAVARAAEQLSTRGYEAHHRLETGVEDVRAQVASFVGAAPDEVGFVRNTADGIGYAADALPFEPGDEVVVFADDYGTVVYPFLARSRRLGDISVRVAGTEDGRVTEGALETALSPRTRAVALSWVRWDSGARADLELLGRRVRAAGAWFVVDAVQGVGALPIDVRASSVDVLAAGSHKWQCGLAGLGLVVVRAGLLSQLRPLRAGLHAQVHGADANHTRGYPFELRPSASRVEDGALNELAIHALGASLDVLSSVGVDAIAQHIHRLGDRLADGWTSVGGGVASPRDRDAWSGIVALEALPGMTVDEVLQRLWSDGIVVGQQRGRLVPAVHLYTSDDDVDRFLAAVR